MSHGEKKFASELEEVKGIWQFKRAQKGTAFLSFTGLLIYTFIHSFDKIQYSTRHCIPKTSTAQFLLRAEKSTERPRPLS